MKQTPLRLLVPIFVALMLVLTACADQQEATPEPAATPTAETAATIPPVASPTILIPEVTKTVVSPTALPTETSSDDSGQPVVVELSPPSRFAVYKEAAVDLAPAMIHEPIAPDLGNVLVPFTLSADQLARLGQSGVVASPGQEKEFFTVYEKARYDNLPVFITSDSLLHSYHLIFDKVLRTAERQYFIPLLRELNAAMLAQTDAQYQELTGTGWEDAALRAVAFVGVGSRLLDPDVEVPAYAEELVKAELALIEEAAGILPSPLFPGLDFGEDYTQYIPRGHYTISEELEAYFKSMMWYGRMTFRLKTLDPDAGRAETRSALLLVQALRQAQVDGRPALDAWLDLYDPTAFMVGRSDDLTAQQYLDVIDAVYGPEPDLAAISEEERLDAFIDAAYELPPPRILGLVISDVQEEEEVTKGFRFMGQRFVPDAYIFRKLIYRNVGTREKPRLLPMGLDVMAAMGSERAGVILDELGQNDYVNYSEQMAKMQAWTAGLSAEEWTETLYNGWLYTLQPLLDVPGEGYPQFMQSDAWLDKQLSASLGSWAELKHDTILYAKQVYAELGGGGLFPPFPKDAVGYVEPVPTFFARLSALATMTKEGLESRNLLTETDADSLDRLIRLAYALQLMAEQELRGEPLNDAQLSMIRFYGGELEHLVMASGDTPEDSQPGGLPVMDEEPQAAVIADVATAPDSNMDGVPDPVVLEEGVGRVDELYVVVPIVAEDGSVFLQVVMGGIFSYYEFPWPAEDRLTDEKWRQMLDGGQAPDRPVWIDTFFGEETAFSDIQRAVYAFQKDIPWAYWDRQPGETWSSELAAVFQPDLDQLQADGQYAGRQWLTASYRSFDLQSPDLAVVTVRESWDDTLYETVGEAPDFDDPVVGHRGPYTLDVTYTLTRTPEGWQVTGAVLENQPPSWE